MGVIMGQINIIEPIYVNNFPYGMREIAMSDIDKNLLFCSKQFEEDLIEFIKDKFSLDDFDNIRCDVRVYILSIKDNSNKDYDIALCDVSGFVQIDFYVENKFLLTKQEKYTFDEPITLGGGENET